MLAKILYEAFSNVDTALQPTTFHVQRTNLSKCSLFRVPTTVRGPIFAQLSHVFSATGLRLHIPQKFTRPAVSSWRFVIFELENTVFGSTTCGYVVRNVESFSLLSFRSIFRLMKWSLIACVSLVQYKHHHQHISHLISIISPISSTSIHDKQTCTFKALHYSMRYFQTDLVVGCI